MTKITPETAPVGARLLIKYRDSYHAGLAEVIVLEWSPSERAIKIRHITGVISWDHKLPVKGVLFEALPSASPLASRLNAALEGLDGRVAAREGVWVERGGDVEC